MLMISRPLAWTLAGVVVIIIVPRIMSPPSPEHATATGGTEEPTPPPPFEPINAPLLSDAIAALPTCITIA